MTYFAVRFFRVNIFINEILSQHCSRDSFELLVPASNVNRETYQLSIITTVPSIKIEIREVIRFVWFKVLLTVSNPQGGI